MKRFRWGVIGGILAALALGVAAQQISTSFANVFAAPIALPGGATNATAVQVSTNAASGLYFPSANSSALCGNGLCSVTATGGGLVMLSGGGISTLGTGNITWLSATAPTITSGFGTSPSITAGAGTLSFKVIVGTGGVGATGVLALTASSNGWACFVNDETTTSAAVFVTKQTADSTTSSTVGNFTTAGASGPWTAGDVLLFHCVGR